MKLYVCWGTWTGATPRPFRRADAHPCGVAHQALRDAGYEPEVVRCYGWEALPGIFNFTPGRRKVKELTGQIEVPVLVTDDGEVVASSSEIVAWAEQPAPDSSTARTIIVGNPPGVCTLRSSPRRMERNGSERPCPP